MSGIIVAGLLTLALVLVALVTSRRLRTQRLKAEDARIRQEITLNALEMLKEEALSRRLHSVMKLTDRRPS